MSDVAALFVERDGIYSRISGVDVWDISRNAKYYDGDLPVVCHPPCQLWVNMAGVNFCRYRKPHNRPGNDGGSFMAALEAVRRCGGVLEHPAGSFAWSTFGLVAPTIEGWWQAKPREWVCEVYQSVYGCKARKKTWLLYVGSGAPLELNWAHKAGSHQVGWFDRKKPTLGKKDASATPERFARLLVKLARQSRNGS
jgi:hypothetical protein